MKIYPIFNLYCFNKINEKLFGHFSYDYYSFFFCSFFLVLILQIIINANPKKKLIIIYKVLISFEMQDIEITPLNYSYPVRGKDVDIYSTVGKKLFQELHVFFQIVNIETDLEPFGLSDFQNVSSEKYLKYDSLVQMTNILDNDLYETGEPFCNVTMKLTEKRRYPK